jgi:hypothetical protein
MAQPTIQTSFASGEWAPRLRARVDIQKYRSGAALLRNFYVDYAGGGASTRPGTRYILQCRDSTAPVRLIPFQPSANLSYVLEFGNGYIRFYSNGAPIIEAAVSVTGIAGNLVTAANSYSPGDWVLIGTSVANSQTWIVTAATGANFNVSDLFGNTSVTPSGSAAARIYTIPSPYSAGDLFPNPITGNPGLKYVQNVTTMILTHPSYAPQALTINSAANWSLTKINFGATIPAPASPTITTSLGTAASPNAWIYQYTVTAVDINGQESVAATPTVLGTAASGYTNINTNAGSNIIAWGSVVGAQSYNVYKASPIFCGSTATVFPTGAPVGFIGNTSALSFTDTNPGIAPDFAQTPPIGQNPFQGAGVQNYTVTLASTYTVVPSVTIGAPPAGGYQATAAASLGILTGTIASLGQVATAGNNPMHSSVVFPGNVTFTITGTAFVSAANGRWLWNVTSYSAFTNAGSLTGAGTATPTNPVSANNCTVTGFMDFNGNNPTANFTWGVNAVSGVQSGAGYTSAPSVTFSPVGATATANLGPISGGNPGCAGFIQERLVFAAQQNAVQSINMSQPASFYNFNVSFPIESDDAISTNIISSELNDIRSLTQVPTGLLALTGKAGWLINGGAGISTTDPITPANITAQPQAFNGANDMNPMKINQDILYVTKKGNYIRDLSYNIWAQLFSGTDISFMSSHLFSNYFLQQWAWSEEPFKTAWAIRNDGTLLSLAYVKEQELVGWAHHDTNGQFLSVCSVIETVNGNSVDAVYVVAQRLVNNQNLQYVERIADRYFTYGAEDAWCVDCGLQSQPNFTFIGATLYVTGTFTVGGTVTLTDGTNSPFTGGMVGWIVRSQGAIYTITAFTNSSTVTAQVKRPPNNLNQYSVTTEQFSNDQKGYTIWQPNTTFGGLSQLVGQTVTGLADGVVVPSTVVSAPGNVTLSNPATKVILGLAFTPQLQTLPLDLGEPTIQGKRKKIVAVTMRVADTLGLQIGTVPANAVTVKDFQLGNLGTDSNIVVTDLVSGDGRTIMDQVWQEAGNYFVQQNLPYPATILGVMPEVIVGDTPEPRREE